MTTKLAVCLATAVLTCAAGCGADPESGSTGKALRLPFIRPSGIGRLERTLC